MSMTALMTMSSAFGNRALLRSRPFAAGGGRAGARRVPRPVSWAVPVALPARLRRPRLLVVGCGDVGQRVARLVQARAGVTQGHGVRVLALTSSPAKVPLLRSLGVVPLLGNLDEPAAVRRLRGLGQRVLYLAPPPGEGVKDPRMAAFVHALRPAWRCPAVQGLPGWGAKTGRVARALPAPVVVYGSTTGVYGDTGGQWVSESRPVAPMTQRASRRVDAEQRVRRYGRSAGVRVSVLRIPGIYAPDRPRGTPRERLLRGVPTLQAGQDGFVNHIHADDLARACLAALWRGRPQRAVNVCDDTVMRMGEYLDFAADLYGLPHPPRITREEAARVLPPTLYSFMAESRRLRNGRLKRELRVVLRWPTVREGLRCDSSDLGGSMGAVAAG